MKNKNKFTLFSILIFGLIIRLISINQSLWLDEGIQAWSASLPLGTLLKDYMPGDFNPPLIHILLWIWTRVFGNSEISLRLPSVLAGIGTVYFSYLILKNIIKDKKLQLAGTVLISLSPLLLYYSQEARMYSLTTFFVTWSMYEFWQILSSKSKKLFRSKYTIATSLMFFSHYLAWFIYPVQILILVATSKTLKQFLSNLKSIFWPLLSVPLILPFLIPQLQSGFNAESDLSAWQNLSSFSFRQLALIPAKILVGRLPLDFNFKDTIIITLPLMLWIYTSFKNVKFKKSISYLCENKAFTFLLFWLTIPILIGILVSSRVSIFTYFRFLYVAPAFYLLLIYSLDKFSLQLKYLILSIFLLISTISSFTYLLNPSYHREDWRNLTYYIHTKSPFYSNQILILSQINRPFWYYDQNQSNLYDYSDFEKDLRFDKYIWLVKYGQPIFEPDNDTEKKLKAYGFVTLEEKHFRGDLVLKLMYNPVSFTAYDFN